MSTANPQSARSKYTPGLVSVVMPAYNCESVLAESVASVLAQTFRNWELVIVDDASTDKSFSVAQAIASRDDRIRVIRLSTNGGVANARNQGMNAARGQYLAFLDSDDLWLPEKLRAQLEFMQRHEIGFSFTRYRRFRAKGSVSSIVRIPDSVTYERLLRGNVIGCLTVMIDRYMIPPFTMSEVGHEDYHAWLQILKTGHTAWGLQEDLARYRVSTASVSGDKSRSALWTWRIYRQLEGLSWLKTVWCFSWYSLRAICARIPI